MLDPTNPVLIRHPAPRNFLSFGPDHAGIDLQALNLFVGPNGSGKSNLIEAISLMRSAPKDMRDVTRKGGGVAEWIWKGDSKAVAKLEWLVSYPKGLKPLRHSIAFHSVGQSFSLDDESVEDMEPRDSSEPDVTFYYRYQQGQPAVNVGGGGHRRLARDTIESDRSILAQRRDPGLIPSWPGWRGTTRKCGSTGNGCSGATPCFANPRKQTCGTMHWKRTSRISACS